MSLHPGEITVDAVPLPLGCGDLCPCRKPALDPDGWRWVYSANVRCRLTETSANVFVYVYETWGGGILTLLLSIFPGVDLLGAAFEEEWPEACVVRGPDPIFGGDIRTFHPPAGAFSGVFGGPPCQMFSGLGNLARARGVVHENLIPEFERVVFEASPAWFLMENVEAAPVPSVPGYVVNAFVVNNRDFGGDQNRERRFSFGSVAGVRIDGRVCSEALAAPRPRAFRGAVTSAHAGHRKTHSSKVTGGKIERYTPAEAAELQGLPADFLAKAPFTQAGRLKAIANGVPLPLGRAIARAVRAALDAREEATA